MKKFEIIEHTADVGLRIYGKDLAELFVNAAVGLMSLIVDAKSISSQKEVSVLLEEQNREELLVTWLNEIVFQFSAHSFLSKKFNIDSISDKQIYAKIKGETVNQSKHKIVAEIKAATYHELEIKDTKDGLEARVIFDT